MPKSHLLVRTEDDDAPLEAVWLYVRRGGDIHVTRTEKGGDYAGVARSRKKREGDDRAWEYTDPFVIDVPPGEIELFYSRGARPIPRKILEEFSGVFIRRDLQPFKLVPSARIGLNVPQVIAGVPTMVARVPRIRLEAVVNADIGAGSCTGEIEHPDPADDPPIAAGGAEPHEPPRPVPSHPDHSAVDHLGVVGRVAAPAKSVRIRALDKSLDALDLKETPEADAKVKEITVATAPGGKDELTVGFSTTLYFDQKVDVLGSIAILVVATEDLSPPILDVFGVLACDIQQAAEPAKEPAGRGAKAPSLPIGEMGFPDTVLAPFGTAEQTAFKRHVYNAHVAWSYGMHHRKFLFGLPPGQALLDVEHGHTMRKDAAEACKGLIARARSDCAVARKADVTLAKSVIEHDGRLAIGAASGYRDAMKELGLWQEYFPRYYRESAKVRADAVKKEQAGAAAGKDQPELYAAWEKYFPADHGAAAKDIGGEHGPAAVYAMVVYFRGLKAAPGYSNHTTGIAMDFGTTQEFLIDGQLRNVALGPSRSWSYMVGKEKKHVDAVDLWRRSWFYQWLRTKKPGAKKTNADEFFFIELPTEVWHWDYTP